MPPSIQSSDIEHSQNANARPFRFKRKRSSSTIKPNSTKGDEPRRRHHHHHHHQHSRGHTRHSSNTESAYPPSSRWDTQPDPETAFRESLFDALADDEGAAFWEGVYGQPIHTYSPYYPNVSDDVEDITGEPKLERMTDEEYVSYVRSKMWEKSHAHIVEERERREQERARRKEKEAQGRKFQVEVEDALRRGEERRRKGRWKQAWEAYSKAWEDGSAEKAKGREKIRWPVESGHWRDVNKDEVEIFFKNGPRAVGDPQVSLATILKKERVNWHPDKWQQRTGVAGLDEETVKLVTSVFQVVDRLWSQVKA